MFWTPLKLLLPSYGAFWLFTFVICTAFWYGWTKTFTTTNPIKFGFKIPALLSMVFSFSLSAFNFMSIYNGAALYTAQQNAQQNSQNAQNQNLDPATKMKGEFLATVEKIIQNPTQLTPEIKTALFKQYAPLFPTTDAKAEYKNAITGVYTCQQTFWKDALASYKTKKAVKSAARTDCEAQSGAFFNREKLLSADAAKNNDKLLEEIAEHKRLPSSDGKTTEITEKMMKDAIEAQTKALMVVGKIFE